MSGPRFVLWRYVVGSFVVRIPVSTSAAMLVPEAMTPRISPSWMMHGQTRM
jgi:hypothetical protein